MRLDCPNCAAAYELSAGMLGPGGAHVQCSACHTRWFAAAPARPAEILSEDQIIDRLERWSGRPRPVVVAGTEVESAADAGFDWLEPEGEEPAEMVVAEPAAAEGLAEPVGNGQETVPEPAVVTEPEPEAEAAPEAAEAPPEREPDIARETEPRPAPRPARPRLEVGPDLSREDERPEPPARGRFGLGLAAAAVLAALAFGLYAGREAIAARLPAAAPALAAYAETVDGARSRLEALLPAPD